MQDIGTKEGNVLEDARDLLRAIKGFMLLVTRTDPDKARAVGQYASAAEKLLEGYALYVEGPMPVTRPTAEYGPVDVTYRAGRFYRAAKKLGPTEAQIANAVWLVVADMIAVAMSNEEKG